MSGAVRHAEQLASKNPQYFIPQQFNNQPIPKSIVERLPKRSGRPRRRCRYLCGGCRHRWHITGVGEVLKSRNPNIHIVAVEPAASPVITQYRNGQAIKPGRHTIQGIGAGFIPSILNVDVIDEVVTVTDDDAFETTRKMAKLEGFMCGISCGAAAWAALQLAHRPEHANKTILVMLPDLGERYLSTKLFPG